MRIESGIRWCKLVLMVAGIFCGGATTSALAQVTEDPYATALPQYAHLEPLESRAVELLDSSPDAKQRAAIIAAWGELQIAAQETKLADGLPHPLAHAVRIKIASQLYSNGENAAAREMLEMGLAGLQPYVAHYLSTQAEGVALLGTLLAHGGDAEEAMPMVRAGYDSFLSHFDAVPESDRGQGILVAKSNLEFSLSQVALRLSRNDEALAYQTASLATREGSLGPNHPDTVASYYGQAGVLRRIGRMEEAERYARIAVERAVEYVPISSPSYARAFEMLGIVLSRSGRPIEATGYLLRALELKRDYEGADNLIFGYGIHNLATIYYQRERFADAAPLFVEAERLFRTHQGKDSPFAVGSLAYAGQIDFAEGREADAITRLTMLDERLGTTSVDLEMVMRVTPDLVRALIRAGETATAFDKAESLYTRLVTSTAGDGFNLQYASLLRAWAASAADSTHLPKAVSEGALMIDYLRRTGIWKLGGYLQTEQRAALDLVMEISTLADAPQLMLSAVALVSGSEIARATSLRDERLVEENPALGESIRQLQDADTAMDRADRSLLAALVAGADTAAEKAELDTARNARAKTLSALTEEFPDWRAQAPRLDMTLEELQKTNASNSALLAVVPAYDGAYLLLVSAEDVVVRRIEIGRAELNTLALRLRESTIGRQFDRDAAEALGRAIFPAEIRDALQDVDKLRILAGGQLASLPFSLIHYPPDAEGDAGYLIDRLALSNLASLPLQHGPVSEVQNTPRRIERFVAFANPTPMAAPSDDTTPGEPASRGIASFFARIAPDFAALSTLPPLPRTQIEAETIAGIFPTEHTRVFSGEEATEGAVRDRLVSHADVLLFATHGLVAGEIEGIAQPALVLTRKNGEFGLDDGLLTAQEIEQLNLSADWVILSACDSAAGMSGGLPAFSGLARAFRYAGANALLVSHWQVRDDVAAFISIETLRHYRTHGDKPAALRHAILALRGENQLAQSGDPSIWAPFALIEN